MTNDSGALIVKTPSANDTNVVEAALRDIKAPVEIPDYWFWFWIGLALLAAAVLGFLIWKFWLKKKLTPAPPPPLPPHVRARRRLREAMAHISDPKLFVSVVSDTVRFYLEESFHLRAPERTTEEFLYELQSSNRLAENVKASLNEFLSRCDLVKFAKYEPTQMELEDLHSAAMRIVEETEPRPTSPSEPTAQSKP
jgi:hypothetical protein